MYRTADDYILALEIAVTERNDKIERLRNTTFWSYAHKLASSMRKIAKEKKELEKKVHDLELQIKSISGNEGDKQ